MKTFTSEEKLARRKSTIDRHRQLVDAGQLLIANSLLKFLVRKQITCGLSDFAFVISDLLWDLGYSGHTDRNGNYVTFYLGV